MDTITAVRAAAARHPSRPAVVEDDRSLSYGELVARVERMAHGLRAHGIRTQDRVVFAVANSLDATVALLGVTGAGAVPVPLNFRSRPEVLDAVIASSAAGALVVDEHTAATVPGLAHRPGLVVVLNGASRPDGAVTLTELGSVSSTAALPSVTPDDIALVLLTSGSTGTPKQIPITHRQSLARVYGLFMNHGFRHDDALRSVGLMPIYHTVGLHAVLLLPLLSGGTYYPVRGFDPPRVLDLIARERITAIFGAPTMFARLLEQPGVEKATATVEHALYAGAAMYPALVTAVARVVTDNFTHIYGNTETYNSLFFRQAATCPGALLPGIQHQVRIAEVGAPDAKPIPDGQEGELLVDMASDEAFDGYADPAQTAAQVVDGWYRTGDMAVRDEQGRIFIRGRADDLIITGGENVYPADVEAMLRRHTGIADCAVLGLPDETWGQVVTALVVPADPELTQREVLAYCRQEAKLESFRRPRLVFLVSELPVNPSGKRAVPELRALAESLAARRDRVGCPGQVPLAAEL